MGMLVEEEATFRDLFSHVVTPPCAVEPSSKGFW
jgi:hypothetical protein